MLLLCTPGVLASHLLAAIAVSESLSLDELWEVSKQKLTTLEVDNFQKNVIWRALTAQSNDLLFTVAIEGQHVVSTANLSYGALLLHGTEQTVRISPTEKCKYLYLTGTTNYQKIVSSLGEKPLELLGVIARHGSNGVLNSLLAQESNQDIRSIGVRLQKLEAAGLIVCRSVYVDKKHTNQSTHVRFVPDSLLAKHNADVEEDINVTRDMKRLKLMIMDALKSSSNHMRGFSDLRKDLKLAGSVSEIKFFKAGCNRLHYGGYIEKLHVELPQTKQRIYAIRLIKDLNPSDDLNEGPDAEVKDEFSDDELETESNTKQSPAFNLIFPPFHQMFLQILARGEEGITIGEILKSLLGTSDYRPYNRAFEQLPTYLSNSKTLKTYKKYPEPYDDYSAIKLFDHEGKVKFYRYFATHFRKETRGKPKSYSLVPKTNKLSLADLEKKHKLSLGKISTESLLKRRENLLNLDERDRIVPEAKPKKRERQVKQEPEALVQLAVDQVENRPKRPRKVTSYKVADQDFINDNEDEGDDENYEPQQKTVAGDDAVMLEKMNEDFIAPDLVQFDLKQRSNQTKKRSTKETTRNNSSASSQLRRDVLVKILNEEGGAAIVTGSLTKSLDLRLDKTTVTDNKTLLRDVAALVKEGLLGKQDVFVGSEGREMKRTLLYLTKYNDRLNDVIEAAQTKYHQEHLKKKSFNRRIVESDLNFHVEEPKQLANVKLATQRRIKSENRLKSIDDAEDLNNAPVKPEIEIDNGNDDGDVFTSYKKNRKARKIVLLSSADTTALNMKRPRRSLKLEKSDATTIYRAVIIHRTFSKEAIDFQIIANLIGEPDGELVRRKWSTLRRLFGGAEAVSKGVETFQSMIVQGIEEGEIEADDLDKCSTQFFLDFWKKFDLNAELLTADEMPLFSSYELNNKKYNLSVVPERQVWDLAEKIEETSMRQKEGLLASTLFVELPPDQASTVEFDDLRSVLKSILCISEDELNSTAAKDLLKAYDAAEIQKAADSMIKDREIVLVSVDENKKFILSEKFQTTLNSRVFTKSFFHDAERFRTLLNDVSKARKGLIISPGISSGEMAALLQLVSDNDIGLLRIDRAIKFENYESRLIDREQIACDIIAHNAVNYEQPNLGSVVHVPITAPCKPMWVNLKSEVNADLWAKLLMIILYHVVFKPGVTYNALRARLQVIFSDIDFNEIIGWMIKNQCLGSSEGLLPGKHWQHILGN